MRRRDDDAEEEDAAEEEGEEAAVAAARRAIAVGLRTSAAVSADAAAEVRVDSPRRGGGEVRRLRCMDATAAAVLLLLPSVATAAAVRGRVLRWV